jgi:hypothetical protein
MEINYGRQPRGGTEMFKLTSTQVTLAGILIIITVASGAFAFPPSQSEPWVRATVIDTTGGKVKSEDVSGTLISQYSTTITIIRPHTHSPLEIPRANITNLETRVQKSQKGKGAAIGLGVGVALGAVIGISSGDDPPGIVSFSAGAKAGVGAVTLGLLGAIIGALASPGDEWEEIPSSSIQMGFQISSTGESGIFLTRRF